MRALVWFRSDLRISDNLALFRATHEATSGAVALFVISPGEWRQHDWAAVKVDYLLRSLRSLSGSLERLNIPLVIAHAPTLADVPQRVIDTAVTHRCGDIFFNREYEVNESRRDAVLEKLAVTHGIKTHGSHDQVYAPPGEVRTGEGRFFTVFTPFKKSLYSRFARIGIPSVIGTPKKQAALPTRPDEVPDRVPGFDSTIDTALWPAGEKAAQKKLNEFVESNIRSYKSDRDAPSLHATSCLSAPLNIGTISCRQCLAAAAEANGSKPTQPKLDTGNEGIVHWMSELVWREFYIHIMIGFPRVCMNRAFQRTTEAIRWNDNEEHFQRWREGRTGVPIVDAGMRQLITTGWMHNRVRMITAMYLTKNLFLHWQLGEKFFMNHLVDGFLASNNGGWQWSASTGTDAAPYFRIFNPVSQSQKFDAEGVYIRRFVPELNGLDNESIHAPWTLPGLLRSRLDYPDPLVDLSSSRLRAIEAFRSLKGTELATRPFDDA